MMRRAAPVVVALAIVTTVAGVARAQTEPTTSRAPTFASSDDPAREAGLVEYVAARFWPHEPIYFIGGDDRPNVKFQISLKYQLFNTDGPLARAVPAVGDVYIAYTQVSLWDLRANSSPFFDTSYQPEVLFQREDLFRGRIPGVTTFDLQAGVAHESNGKAGPDSRSLNVYYVRPVFSFGDPLGRDHGFFASVGPRVFGYFGDLAENPDIDDYRGHADLRLIVGRWEGLQLASTIRIPDDFDWDDAGSVQLDLSFPLRRLSGNNLDLYLHAQYFTGFGESLLRYDEADHTLRVGVSVVR